MKNFKSNDKETTDVSFLYNAGSQFEAIIKFNVNAGKTQIWMDNLLIGTLLIKPANMMANIVHFVQVRMNFECLFQISLNEDCRRCDRTDDQTSKKLDQLHL